MNCKNCGHKKDYHSDRLQKCFGGVWSHFITTCDCQKYLIDEQTEKRK